MIKWGIIGIGNIGKDMAVTMMENNYLKSVYTRNIINNEQLKILDNTVKVYDNRQAFFDSEIDAVYIASPNQAHYNDIKDALLAHKHVLCEKAIVASYEELIELENLALTNNLIIKEAMTIFNNPLLNKAKLLIDEGIIGDVSNITCFFGSVKPYDFNNRFFNKELGGGVMLDIGTYALSMIQFFLDDDLVLINKDVEYDNNVDSKVIASLKCLKVDALINLSFKASLPKLCIVSGSKGYLEVIDYPRARQLNFSLIDGTKQVYEDSFDDLALEIINFNNSIIEKDNTNLLFNKTKNVIKIIDEIINN